MLQQPWDLSATARDTQPKARDFKDMLARNNPDLEVQVVPHTLLTPDGDRLTRWKVRWRSRNDSSS